jgi:hypothetical protein
MILISSLLPPLLKDNVNLNIPDSFFQNKAILFTRKNYPPIYSFPKIPLLKSPINILLQTYSNFSLLSLSYLLPIKLLYEKKRGSNKKI